MSANASEINLIISILAGSLVISGAILGGFRLIYCRGRKKQSEEDSNGLLNRRVEKLESDWQLLEDDIKQYRKEQLARDEKIFEKLNENATSLSYIQGKMSKRDKTTPT